MPTWPDGLNACSRANPDRGHGLPVELIEVRAWGRTAGALGRDRGRAYAFEYGPAWLRLGVDLASILMPGDGRARRRIYTFPELNPETYAWLPPTIADALPDRYGNGLVNAWMVRNGIGVAQITALDCLAYLGDRGLGALEEIIRVGTSAGGARAKAIVNFAPATGEIRAGNTGPGPGFEPWLITFDGVGADDQLGRTQSYGRIEYAYSLMAVFAGITMSETRLLQENGRAHFMARRFDRDHGGRLHLQSLCALAAVDFNAIATNDYAQCLGAIRDLGLGADADAVAQGFRRVVFNVAGANCDDHSKNVGFLMDERGIWSLAPVYDVWTRQHLMSVGGQFFGISRKDLIDMADRFDVPATAAVIDEVESATRRFAEFAERTEVPAAAVAEVCTGIARIPR